MKNTIIILILLYSHFSIRAQQPVANLSAWGATNGQVIKATINGAVWTNSAAGNNSEIQFNVNGQLGSSNTLRFDGNLLLVPGLLSSGPVYASSLSSANDILCDGIFIGDGSGLNNLPLSAVIGLTNTLAWLTNNGGNPAAVTNNDTRQLLFRSASLSLGTNDFGEGKLGFWDNATLAYSYLSASNGMIKADRLSTVSPRITSGIYDGVQTNTGALWLTNATTSRGLIITNGDVARVDNNTFTISAASGYDVALNAARLIHYGNAYVLVNNGRYVGWRNSGIRLTDTDSSTLLLASDSSVANALDLQLSDLFARDTVVATNGLVNYQRTTIPTNSIPASSSGITNYVLVNLTNTINGGGMHFIATNHTAAGSFILQKINVTQTTWP